MGKSNFPEGKLVPLIFVEKKNESLVNIIGNSKLLPLTLLKIENFILIKEKFYLIGQYFGITIHPR